MKPTRTPEDVKNALKVAGLNIEIQHFDESTKTAPEAANAIGCELGAIIKSLCFTVDSEPVVILTAGDRRVDDRKVADLYQVGRKRVRIADAETTMQSTGYAPGGVPPIGHETELPVLIDETLGRYEIVYGAAGTPHSIFPIPYQTLVEITGGSIKDITKD